MRKLTLYSFRYTGQWKDGQQHGKGIFRKADGPSPSHCGLGWGFRARFQVKGVYNIEVVYTGASKQCCNGCGVRV